jgi:hypothetical protein
MNEYKGVTLDIQSWTTYPASMHLTMLPKRSTSMAARKKILNVEDS